MTYTKFVLWAVGIMGTLFALGVMEYVSSNCRARRERAEAEERRREKAEAAAAAKAERDAQKAARQAEAEERRRAKAEAAAAAKAERGRPRKNPEPDQAVPAAIQAAEAQLAEVKRQKADSDVMRLPHGNNAFAGHTVAFTGKLPGMTRAEAIAAVVANGGKAYETMPAGTTLLVVGDNKGRNSGKLDKADRWIGQVRKITPAQFNEMLKQPPTLTPDEFAAMIAA